MSNLRRPAVVGVENILQMFDNLTTQQDTVFAVWYSERDIAFQCTLEDIEQQKAMLAANLEQLERSGNTDLLYLKLYPQTVNGGYIDNKSKAISVTPFQVTEFQAAVNGPVDIVSRPQGMSPDAWQLWQQLKDVPGQIESKINAAVEAKIAELFPEDQETEPEPMDKIIGVINGLSQNPAIMGLITKAISFLGNIAPAPRPQIGNVNDNFMSETQTQTAPSQQIPYDQSLMETSLSILSYHCDIGTDLAKLAQIAQEKPEYFKMLLNMLRNS